MAYGNEQIFSSYLGNGALDTFAITFAFIEGEDEVVKVRMFDESSNTNQTILLDANDVSNRYVTLDDSPTDPSLVTLSILGDATVYVNGVDFKVVNNLVLWGGLPLEADILATKTLVLNYPTSNGEIFPQPVKDGAGTFDYTVNLAGPTVTFNNPVTDGYRIYIYRDTAETSPVVYNDFRFPYETVERDFDRLYQLVQENRGALENANLMDFFLDKTGIDGETPVLSEALTVIGVTQGRYSPNDVIAAGTTLEEILKNMLQIDTPPVFTLAGDGTLLVESGTIISPTLTPSYTANDAGAANNYELRKDSVPIHTDSSPSAYMDGPYSIVDESIIYEATVDYDPNILPAGSVVSNTVTYQGARAAFFGVGGDIVNIRSNPQSLVGVQIGSNLVAVGDDVETTFVFAYPDALPPFNSLILSNVGGNFDITADVVQETDQIVNDAGGGNPVTYKVYSYTALIPFKSSDTLTVTI